MGGKLFFSAFTLVLASITSAFFNDWLVLLIDVILDMAEHHNDVRLAGIGVHLFPLLVALSFLPMRFRLADYSSSMTTEAICYPFRTSVHDQVSASSDVLRY